MKKMQIYSLLGKPVTLYEKLHKSSNINSLKEKLIVKEEAKNTKKYPNSVVIDISKEKVTGSFIDALQNRSSSRKLTLTE